MGLTHAIDGYDGRVHVARLQKVNHILVEQVAIRVNHGAIAHAETLGEPHEGSR